MPNLLKTYQWFPWKISIQPYPLNYLRALCTGGNGNFDGRRVPKLFIATATPLKLRENQEEEGGEQ